jgi:hypothetical protein
MRWGIISLLSLFCLGLILPAVQATEPLWALVSTEVDETWDNPVYTDRQMLELWPPSWTWSGLAGDIFFDPGPLLQCDPGLDAFDIQRLDVEEYFYFSTEVDFEYGGVAYQDEDLLQYDPGTGLVTEALDIGTIMGDDYGLDAGMWWYEEREASWQFVFSTEVGGELPIGDELVEFTDGDILVTDGLQLTGYLHLEDVFGRNVGLDAMHAWADEWDGRPVLILLMSTEVDGVLAHNVLADPIAFRDEDILQLSFAYDEDGPTDTLVHAELGWEGIEGFGQDVGLDALYIRIPEPGTVLLIGLGLGALVVRLKRKQ